MATSTKDNIDFGIDYYAVLGLAFGATDDEIAKAFRQKAKELHPDRHKENKEWFQQKFEQVGIANRILTDVVAKAEYDKRMQGKVAAEQRLQGMSEKKRKLREELREREDQAAKKQKTGTDTFVTTSTGQQQQQAPTSIKEQAKQIKAAGGYDKLYALKSKLLAKKLNKATHAS